MFTSNQNDVNNVYSNFFLMPDFKIVWLLELQCTCSSSGGPRLKGQDIVTHFLKIIKEPRFNCHIGVDYCKLLKNVLSVPMYQSDITVKTWQGKGRVYFNCIVIS